MKLKKLFGALAIIGAASGAIASDQVLTMSPLAGGGYFASFSSIGDANPLDGGDDVLTFALPGAWTPGTYLVHAEVNGINLVFNVDSSNLNGINVTDRNIYGSPYFFIDTGTYIGNTLPPFKLSIFGNALSSDPMSPSLSAPSSYFGTVSAALTAPVPEPESYAMFLAGLGIMGAVARRRSKKA